MTSAYKDRRAARHAAARRIEVKLAHRFPAHLQPRPGTLKALAKKILQVI